MAELRDVKRYTLEDWKKLEETGMAWELFPGGPSTFIGTEKKEVK